MLLLASLQLRVTLLRRLWCHLCLYFWTVFAAFRNSGNSYRPCCCWYPFLWLHPFCCWGLLLLAPILFGGVQAVADVLAIGGTYAGAEDYYCCWSPECFWPPYCCWCPFCCWCLCCSGVNAVASARDVSSAPDDAYVYIVTQSQRH